MSNFVNKYFKRSKSLKVVLVGIDRKIKEYYVIPVNNTVLINHNNVKGRYLFDPDKVFVGAAGSDKFKPIIVVVEGNAEALNPYDLNTVYDSSLFEVALSNNLVKDIVRTTDSKPDKFGNLFYFIIIGMLGALIFLALKNDASIIPEVIETIIHKGGLLWKKN